MPRLISRCARTNPESEIEMTNVKFKSVFASAMASGDHAQLIILRVEGEDVWEGAIAQGETVDVDVKMPITTLHVEMGTRGVDALGHPSDFLGFVHLVENPPPVEEAVWTVTAFDSGDNQTVFRSKVPGHEGRFEVRYVIPSP
ncbi:hypothetical protein ABT143_13025 [Streptomyces sp. NPDC002033]|uniref:hypothetical protein n=1 Tax=unclassified Streptomyces TaxID=2593676 RepID=UPI00332B5E3C